MHSDHQRHCAGHAAHPSQPLRTPRHHHRADQAASGQDPGDQERSRGRPAERCQACGVDTVEVTADKPAEEEVEGKAEVKTEPESELEMEESEEKEGEAKVKEEEQTAASPVKPAAPASASRQPVWNEVKETG